MTEKKYPVRTCIACREERPKRDMMRIVKNASGEISLDFSGRLAGRGAYVCKSEECVRKLRQKRLLNKTFSMPVDDEVYTRIEEELLGG